MRRERDRWIDKFDRLKERRGAHRHNDDEVREFRRNHAAKVIQRQWRTYHEHSPKKRSYASRSSHQGNLTRDVRVNRSFSVRFFTLRSFQNALKIVQAALRGYLQRDVSHRSSSTVNGNHRTGSSRLSNVQRALIDERANVIFFSCRSIDERLEICKRRNDDELPVI